MTLTLAAEIFGWLLVVVGFLEVANTGRPFLGGAGAVILGLAFAGAFNL